MAFPPNAKRMSKGTSSLNYTIFSGNIGRDAKVTKTGATINVAITSFYNDKDGTIKEETCWRTVFIKNPLAESISKYLTKGKTVIVVGHMATWKPREEGERPFDVIVAERVVMLDRPSTFADKEAEADPAGREVISERHEAPTGSFPDEDLPF